MRVIDLDGDRPRLFAPLLSFKREPRGDGDEDCEVFEPSTAPPPLDAGSRDCMGDGHYRCIECDRLRYVGNGRFVDHPLNDSADAHTVDDR